MRDPVEGEAQLYRARFRFRVRKKFNVEEPTLTFKVRDHDVVLTSEDSDAPINKTSWLVMNCRNFGSEAEAQQRLLDELALAATSSTIGTSEERDEVAASMKRGLHKVGLRQGVLRLLDRHGLSGLRKSWDDLRSQKHFGPWPRPKARRRLQHIGLRHSEPLWAHFADGANR
jgi:hypothetical protein